MQALKNNSVMAELDDFPEVVLVEIFKHLSIKGLSRARSVCKRWNKVGKLDILWKKFIPETWGFEPGEAHEQVETIWLRSLQIGEERWYADPIDELNKYEYLLRKAEYHNCFMHNSKARLFWRLNPCYDFCEVVEKKSDVHYKKVCEALSNVWDKFVDRDNNDPVTRIVSAEAAMDSASIRGISSAMESILEAYEPHWFLQALDLEEREIDSNCNITNVEAGDNDDEVDLNCLGDDDNFGPQDDEKAWKSKVNKRLPLHLYQQIKTMFAGGGEWCINYPLDDGSWNENVEYASSVMISDTAAFYFQRYYEL